MLQGIDLKHPLFALASAGCLIVSLWASVRPPINVDGFVSGSLAGPPVASGITLASVDISFLFPAFREDLSDDKALVEVAVRYGIFNGLKEEVEIAAGFPAVDILNVTATLDGKPLAVGFSPDAAAKSAGLSKLALHRSAFMPPVYKDFLTRLREVAGLKDRPDADWPLALKGKDLGGIGPNEIYPVGRWRANAGEFRSAGMKLPLKPGLNELRVSYTQRMFVNERATGALEGWPQRGLSGLDYLLYPSVSWPLTDGFRLTVSVEIPEMPSKLMFWTIWLKPAFKSNLAFREGRAERPHVRLHQAEFEGFPADILSLLVWFDGKPAQSLADQGRSGHSDAERVVK